MTNHPALHILNNVCYERTIARFVDIIFDKSDVDGLLFLHLDRGRKCVLQKKKI